MRYALEMNARPTTFLRKAQPFGEWDDLDFSLAEAWRIMQDERCQQCGLPRYVCHSENPDIQFEIDVEQCQAVAEVAMYEKSEKESHSDGWEPPAGTKTRPTPSTMSGADPASYRNEYYDSLQRQAEEYMKRSGHRVE